MNLPVAAVAVGLIVVVGGGFAATQALDFDMAPFNFLDSGIDCEYQVVEIDNRTFSSKSELRNGVEQRNGNWTEINSKLEFRTQNGVLEYRSDTKHCAKLQGGTN